MQDNVENRGVFFNMDGMRIGPSSQEHAKMVGRRAIQVSVMDVKENTVCRKKYNIRVLPRLGEMSSWMEGRRDGWRVYVVELG